MRFGKKLALQVIDDQSGAPYLSHKLMKEAINKTVRELRMYQSRLQGSEIAWRDGVVHDSEAIALPGELKQLEARISDLDRQLFLVVDEDLLRILEHVRASEAYLAQCMGLLQNEAVQTGMLVKDAQIQKLEKILPVKTESPQALCQQMLELRIRTAPMEVKASLEALSLQYNDTVDATNRHSQYLEINVAGFRKLLKRHEKQIPVDFCSRPMPFLGFHQIVTRQSIQLMDDVKLFGAILEDAWSRLVASNAQSGLQCAKPELTEVKSVGAECQMILQIQKELKNARHNPGLGGPAILYPNPRLEFMAQPNFAGDFFPQPLHVVTN